MYYGARYYMPEMRRFISADTIVPGAANPLAYNRYAYVFNSPVNYADPTGHAPVCFDSCYVNPDLSGGDVSLSDWVTTEHDLTNNFDEEIIEKFEELGLEIPEGLSPRDELTLMWTLGMQSEESILYEMAMRGSDYLVEDWTSFQAYINAPADISHNQFNINGGQLSLVFPFGTFEGSNFLFMGVALNLIPSYGFSLERVRENAGDPSGIFGLNLLTVDLQGGPIFGSVTLIGSESASAGVDISSDNAIFPANASAEWVFWDLGWSMGDFWARLNNEAFDSCANYPENCMRMADGPWGGLQRWVYDNRD